MSLNSGFHQVSTNKITADEQRMIDEFFARGGRIEKCPPANAASNEAVRATNELVAQKRAEFRKNRRGKK
jgi:hypothetical protein